LGFGIQRMSLIAKANKKTSLSISSLMADVKKENNVLMKLILHDSNTMKQTASLN
jgi:hypothetical protein